MLRVSGVCETMLGRLAGRNALVDLEAWESTLVQLSSCGQLLVFGGAGTLIENDVIDSNDSRYSMYLDHELS